MSVFEVVGGGDRRSMIRRYEKKSKYDAIHELVDIIQCNWRQLELLEKEIAELKSARAEPVAWRMFDGEGSYDYTDCEETAERWREHLGEKYADWLQPLY